MQNLNSLSLSVESILTDDTAGKGFAVLASEIRKLAERSQNAAGEILHMTQSSATMAEETDKTFAELDKVIQRNAAHSEQLSGTAEGLSTQAGELPAS